MSDADTIVGSLQLSEQWVRSHIGHASVESLAVMSAFDDSMEPALRNGDLVLFDRGITQLRMDAIYAVALNGELFIKRIQRRPDKTVVMKSDNPLYEPYVVAPQDMQHFEVIGKVVFAWNGRRM